jgi:hypothetical protein
MANEQQSVRSWITEGIMIAGITALAYLVSFLYEAGFCRAFNIPLEFISLSLRTILVAVGALFIIAISVFLVVNALLMIGVFDFSNPISVAISRIAIFSLVLIAYILVYAKQWRSWIWMVIPLLFVALLDFIYPLISQPGKGSYRNKIESWEQKKVEEDNRSLGRLLHNRFGNTGTTIFLIIWFVLSTAYAAGKARAQQGEHFLVVEQSTELVVLRSYSDYLLTAPLNRATKEVESKFYLLKMSEMNKTPLTLEKVGPLTVKQ